jgi:hypothetical protein
MIVGRKRQRCDVTARAQSSRTQPSHRALRQRIAKKIKSRFGRGRLSRNRCDRPCDGDGGENSAIEHDRTTVRKVGTAFHQTKFAWEMQFMRLGGGVLI